MKTVVDPFVKYQKEYWKRTTSKQRKGEILDTIGELTGMHRKSVVRKFKVLQFRDPLSVPVAHGRPRVYDDDVVCAVKDLWEVSGKVCGELLHPMIDEYISQCKKYGQWHHSTEVEKKVLVMSEATLKRKVTSFYKKDKDSFRKGVSTTKPSAIKALIPIKTDSWFDAQIGEGQLDTVVHCGVSLCGDMAYTLNFTDYKTYWVGLHAQMNKGEKATVESLLHIKEHQLPFPMLSIHPDTGSEFINYHMKACCDALDIEMTRSRPGHCNDNMCVEERNGHIVRKKIGYIRIDCQESVIVLNEYYDKLCVLFNHFVAVRRTQEKVRVGARYQRRFEKARTPYQMVIESKEVEEELKKELRMIHEGLNIFELKEEMRKLLGKIYEIQKEKREKLF